MEIIIEDANAGEKLIKELFNQQTRTYFNLAINKGYELAWHAKENTNFLSYSKSRGGDLLSYLKNFAVEFALMKYIESGLLPYKYEIKSTRNKSSKYLVISDSHHKFEMCVNQVPRLEKIGREAFYRNKRIKSFNSYIKFDETDDHEIITEAPTYFELNHGYQDKEPNFVVIGIPGTNGKWVDRVDISKELTLVQNTNTIKTQAKEIEFNFEDLQDYIEKSDTNDKREF